MNQPSFQQWSQQEPNGGGMGQSMSEEDFSDFLDLDNINIEFTTFDNNGGGDMQNAQSAPAQETDESMLGGEEMLIDQYGQMGGDNSQMGEMHQGGQQPQDDTSSTMDFGTQPQYQQQEHYSYNMMPDMNYMGQFSVPPTPNSAQMYPGTAQYPLQLESQASYNMDQQYHMRKDDVMRSLTPLVSPQIPGSTQSHPHLREITMPCAFLSPLTSPAIHPHPNTNGFTIHSQPHTADSSLTGSPIDLNFDMSGDVSAPPEDKRPKKARKKATSTRTAVSSSRSRLSTAQKRKNSLSVSIPVGIQSIHDSPTPTPKSAKPSQMPDTTPALGISVLPQPHAEAAMAPPRMPVSLNGTPITLQPRSKPDGFELPAATPASLMRLRQQQQQQQQTQSGISTQSPYHLPMEISSPGIDALGPSMEDLRLPDSASFVHGSSERVFTQRVFPQDPKLSPALGARAQSQTPRAILPSPAVSANESSKGGRNSRKRSSPNGVLISPALRPKISPNIQPSLADSSKFSNDSHAQLLTTKSNYQNIIEGTTLPGVNYPAELSTNLTSKRTSHKIAEQGRRNRINYALQELQTLLPKSPALGGNSSKDSAMTDANDSASGDINVNGANGSGGDGDALPKTPLTPAALGGNSKAATVEQAIDHLKHLNNEMEKKDEVIAHLKVQMAKMREKMGAVAVVT